MRAASRYLLAIAGLLMATPGMLLAQEKGNPINFNKAWSRGARSEKDIRMETTPADLVIDTVALRLVVKNKRLPLNIKLNQIKKLTFDASSHMRGSGGGRGAGLGGLLGGAVGAGIEGGTVTDHWCVINYSDDAGLSKSYLLEVGEDQASDVIALLTRLLPSSVEEVHFAEKQHEISKEETAPFNDDYEVTVLKENRPTIPEVHPESALVVIAAPTVDFGDAGRGGQYRLYANRNIVAVNKTGTYAFFNLAPGTYSLLSKTGNISVLDVIVEAGKGYYFFENSFMGFSSAKARLSRQSEALVRQEITGMYFAEWHPKAP
jgi:hypothetical protein